MLRYSALFSVVLLLFYINTSVGSDFFRPAQDKGLSLPKDKLYPNGQLFLFSGYSPKRENFEQLKQAKFTVLGPIYKSHDKKLLDNCKAMKISCIYTIREKISKRKLSKSKWVPDWKFIENDIAAKVKELAKEKNICLWYISPEELRWWRENEYLYLQKAYNAIKKADPEKRPVWMYEPGHRNAKSLAKMAPYQDIIGKGCYTNYSGMEKNRIWVKWTVEQEIEAIKQTGGSKKIPILVPEMFKDPKEDKTKVKNYARHDVYLGLVSGAKGIVIFSLSKRRGFSMHQKYIDAYCEIAEELMKNQNLHRYFLFGTPRDDLKIKISSGPQKLELNFKKIHKTYPSVNFANIALGNRRLLVVVNSANEKVEVKFSGFPEKIKTVNAFTSAPDSAPDKGNLKIALKPLEVRGFVFYK
jgi:hypothetical protein